MKLITNIIKMIKILAIPTPCFATCLTISNPRLFSGIEHGYF